MKLLALEETDLTVPESARLAKKGTVILTRKGKPLAVVKALSATDWESLALANNPTFTALIEESRRSYQEEGGIGLDDLRHDLGLKNRQRRRTTRGGKKKS